MLGSKSRHVCPPKKLIYTAPSDRQVPKNTPLDSLQGIDRTENVVSVGQARCTVSVGQARCLIPCSGAERRVRLGAMLKTYDTQKRSSLTIAMLLGALSAVHALPSPGGPHSLASRGHASKPDGVSNLRGGGVLDPVPHRRWSPPLVVTIGLASTLWGYDQGVITGALLTIVPEYKLETRPDLQGMVAAAATVGTMIGSSTVGINPKPKPKKNCIPHPNPHTPQPNHKL